MESLGFKWWKKNKSKNGDIYYVCSTPGCTSTLKRSEGKDYPNKPHTSECIAKYTTSETDLLKRFYEEIELYIPLTQYQPNKIYDIVSEKIIVIEKELQIDITLPSKSQISSKISKKKK
eukprot:Anaeramoba_ignava/a221923_13.p1 GENE.a221923_13~~a221923_13.p1  ORF type:complete len:119 (-),score=14.04 a221923_13:628-984(-)